tara:strand:- start:532 stop:786 length:255 start_codon:yes stop_codon:yes gene_type:complete
MNKEQAHHRKGAQRRWRHEKSATLAAALRGIAALEGVPLPRSNDVGRLRDMLKFHVGKDTLNKMLTRAAVQYEAANPKPRKYHD